MDRRVVRSISLDDPRIHEATEDDELLERVVGFYHQTLRADGSAMQWLAEQWIGPAAVDHFQVGLANRTLGTKLPIKKLQAGTRVRERLRDLGVLRDSGHEHLNGCVVVPLHDEHGRSVQIFGQRIASTARRSDDAPVRLHEDRRGLLGVEALGADRIVVAASILDAIALWSLGYRHVTALHGLDGPLDGITEALRAQEPKAVVLAWPGGAEAERVVTTLRKRLAGTPIHIQPALLPESFGTYRQFLRIVPDPEARLLELLGPPPQPRAAPKQGEDARPDDVRRSFHGGDRAAPALTVAASAASSTAVPTHDPGVGPAGSALQRICDREPATPIPGSAAPPDDRPTSGSDPDEVVLQFDDRRWRIRGLAANGARGTLRVNVLAAREGAGLHMDVLDVCSARHRAAFVRAAAIELCIEELIVRRDMAQVLLALEQAQDERLTRIESPTPRAPEMTDAQREAAMDLLKDPRLLDRVLDDLATLGVVGERDNLMLAYLAAISLPRPLAVAVLSASAAGKSSLLDAVPSLVPTEDRVAYSALTGQSLYYMGGTDLRHKVLSVAEERGVARATYALKLLQSEGCLTLATTGKDAGGRLVSQAHTVQGPVALMMTTTSLELDEELQSRCLVLTVDESPEQTRLIHAEQRLAHTIEGLRLAHAREAMLQVHHDAQRLLRPLTVVHPESLDLSFADLRVQARRDFRKLLGLVEAIAVLHQHQREIRTLDVGGRAVDVVHAQASDVALARRLLQPVLPGPHELPPHTRRVLGLLDDYVTERARRLQVHRDHVRFSQRELRERLSLGRSQLAMHMRRLVEVELVRAHRGPAAGSYSLCIDVGSGPAPSGVDPGGVRGGSGVQDLDRLGVISSASHHDPASTPPDATEPGHAGVHVPAVAAAPGSAR